MSSISDLLFETIVSTVKGIDTELKALCGESIFFAPELYVAFRIGMEVTKEAKRRGINGYKWMRELKETSTGPVDIVFQASGENIYVELKLADTYHEYEDDIQKLLSIPTPDAKKYFCVLLDSFSPENDDRLIRLEEEFRDRIVAKDNLPGFEAKTGYKKQTYCCINLFQVQ